MTLSAIPKGHTFVAYSDGSCLGNPGPGGWAYLIDDRDGTRQIGRGSAATSTNNAMELTAAIECLSGLGNRAVGVLHTDSKYVVNGANSWRAGWEKRGYRGTDGKPVKNLDLWRALFAEIDARPGVQIAWVKGHATCEQNNLVDQHANAAAHDQSPPVRTRYSLGEGTTTAPQKPSSAETLAATLLARAERLCALPGDAEPILAEMRELLCDSDELLADFLFSPLHAIRMSPIEAFEAGKGESALVVLRSLSAGAYV